MCIIKSAGVDANKQEIIGENVYQRLKDGVECATL